MLIKKNAVLTGDGVFTVGVMGVKGNMEMKRVSSPRGSKDTLSHFPAYPAVGDRRYLFSVFTYKT